MDRKRKAVVNGLLELVWRLERLEAVMFSLDTKLSPNTVIAIKEVGRLERHVLDMIRKEME